MIWPMMNRRKLRRRRDRKVCGMPEGSLRGSASSSPSCIGGAPIYLPGKCALQWGINQNPTGEFILADDKLFKAEYLGSGTFSITKPKRKKIKVRQSALKNPRRGSRK